MNNQNSGTVILDQTFTVEGGNFDKAGQVAGKVKNILKKFNLPPEIVRRAVLVTYESEINIVSYAYIGTINIKVMPDSIIIEAQDEGPGIADIELAMQEGYSTATDKIREMGFGAGMGLPNIQNYSNFFRIKSEYGRGTRLKMVINLV
ncbi:MAG: hypothetical protein N2317_03065 [Syntrophales bacterium]|nr:hypothetical protein [Syntrophales bacterium]